MRSEEAGADLLLQRCHDQETAIARLMIEAQELRDENAGLLRRLELVTGDRMEATIPTGPAAPATARAALTRWLTDQVPLAVLEDARLLASELVTNSVQHAASSNGGLRIAVQVARGALRVEVRDAGAEGTVAPRAPDRKDGGGFGLQLVDRLATRWGVQRSGDTRVWFEMDRARATG